MAYALCLDHSYWFSNANVPTTQTNKQNSMRQVQFLSFDKLTGDILWTNWHWVLDQSQLSKMGVRQSCHRLTLDLPSKNIWCIRCNLTWMYLYHNQIIILICWQNVQYYVRLYPPNPKSILSRSSNPLLHHDQLLLSCQLQSQHVHWVSEEFQGNQQPQLGHPWGGGKRRHWERRAGIWGDNY